MVRLLIVDDSQVIRRKIHRLVKDRGIHVVGSAPDGEKAVLMAKQTQPEMITMDMTMPNMDGLTCVKEIMSFAPETKILIISALKDKATAIAALRLGARGFLCKPFSETELCDALNKLME